jgi:putative CocE/NonD family hydrolase
VLPAPSFPKTVSQDIAIAMADGVHLGATVTFPSLDGSTPAPGKFPVVVSITPYGRKGECGCPDRPTFAERGIIAATVDTRGTGGSEGNLDQNYFSPLEARDGAAVIEYFGTQDYSSGRVGMAGGSYVGITQLLAAEQQPPHLSAIVPAEVLSDIYRDAFAHGGIMNLFFDAQYIAVQGGPGLLTPNTDPSQLPMTVMAKLQQLEGTPIAFDYLARPDDDPFYQDRSPIYHADRIRVPVLLLGGWRDGLSQRGGPEMYHALAQRPQVETRLHMDPCTHKGCGAPFAPLTDPPGLDDSVALEFEFLSHYLLGTPAPARAPLRYYVQAANAYVEGGEWPPRATHFERLYLDAATLAGAPPAQAGSVNYVTNPSAGLSMSFDEYGTVAISPYLPTDQRLESEQGVTFRTAPLAQALTFAGPIALHLVAQSSASDTDWIAKLADVAPDGSEALITNGYLRASQRALDPAKSRTGVPYHTHVDPTPITPNVDYAYDVEIWPTAYTLAAGHQLQLRIVSVDVPTHLPARVKFDRNDPAATQVVPMAPAINTIELGGTDPSYLLLPEQ